MKVLVFGGSGQLGKCIQDVYCDNPMGDVFLFYGSDTCDIASSSAVNNIVKSEKPDFIVNCAAYTNAYNAEFSAEGQKLAYQVNTIGAMNVAYACKENNVKLIHISTDYVFNGEGGFYGALDECLPINVYGRSKYLGEEAIEQIMSEETFLIIRTSWLFSKYSKNSFTKMADAIMKGEPVKAVEDQVGCPTYSLDLANFIVDEIRNTVEYPPYGLCQYTNLGVASRYDIAKEIERYYGKNGLVEPITSEDSGDAVPRPKVCIMSKYWAKKMGKTRHWIEALHEFLDEYTVKQ